MLTPSTRPATTWPRLRLNGLIGVDPGTYTYDLTPDGQRVAISYTNVHDRLLRPLIAPTRHRLPPSSATRFAPSIDT